MTTEKLIETIRSRSREAEFVAIRHALYYYMYMDLSLPGTEICTILNRTRQNIYGGIYRHRDFLESNDRIAVNAKTELMSHSITCLPSYVEDARGNKKFAGHKLLIDNIIF